MDAGGGGNSHLLIACCRGVVDRNAKAGSVSITLPRDHFSMLSEVWRWLLDFDVHELESWGGTVDARLPARKARGRSTHNDLRVETEAIRATPNGPFFWG